MKKLGWLAPGIVAIVALALLSHQFMGGSEGASAQDEEVCDPVLPTTFTGTVAICGEAAPDCTVISAIGSDGITWATAHTSGGSYAMDVPETMPVWPPCFLGGTISFQCDGVPAAETGEASGGLVELDLTCCPGVPSVDIDIKPGSDPNSIHPRSNGVIPVAILTTEDFDATTVDPETVVFAGASPVHYAIKDVDKDRDYDLILHFRTQDTDIAPGNDAACLTGETYDGIPIIGCDSIRTVP